MIRSYMGKIITAFILSLIVSLSYFIFSPSSKNEFEYESRIVIADTYFPMDGLTFFLREQLETMLKDLNLPLKLIVKLEPLQSPQNIFEWLDLYIQKKMDIKVILENQASKNSFTDLQVLRDKIDSSSLQQVRSFSKIKNYGRFYRELSNIGRALKNQIDLNDKNYSSPRSDGLANKLVASVIDLDSYSKATNSFILNKVNEINSQKLLQLVDETLQVLKGPINQNNFNIATFLSNLDSIELADSIKIYINSTPKIDIEYSTLTPSSPSSKRIDAFTILLFSFGFFILFLVTIDFFITDKKNS